MNDEIKEILEYLKTMSSENEPDIELSRKEIKILLYYITNLQQENERLEHENFCLREYLVINKKSIPNDLTKDKNFMEIIDMPTYEDYKSRCEKADEFINENTELEHDGDDYGYMEWINIINMDTMTFINNLSDILNGRK